MQRYFNTEGACNPAEHYMVSLDERLDKIKRLYVDRGKYFVINRGRQYGKTTTLRALAEYLRTEYTVVSMDFQGIGAGEFVDEAGFSLAFSQMFIEAFYDGTIEKDALEPLVEFADADADGNRSLRKLFVQLSRVCEAVPKPLVLLIDEVDSASNHQVFLDFLAMLRKSYLERKGKAAFYSVILAGVYDIKNLKLKLRPEEEHKFNSPWNIAARFELDMSFSKKEIEEMLAEYETDWHTQMNQSEIAGMLYDFTSGYPYLVSRFCKLLAEKLPELPRFGSIQGAWTKEGVLEASKLILEESSPLFESMIRQLSEYPDMKRMLHAILFQGKRISYNADTAVIRLAAMFGYIINREGSIQVANRIFETRLYNFFLSEEELTNVIYDEAQGSKNQFITNRRLNMKLVLEKFVLHFSEIYGDNDSKFIEDFGRKFFLLYLKPIINGVGNYYIEAQTRDARRTDVIVDYLGEQFVVELKIWRGREYNERGEEQLADYLEYYHIQQGYMLSFNFNKNKKTGLKEITVGNKTIIEAVV